MTNYKSSATQGVAVAYEGLRDDGIGVVFKTEPHSARLDYTVACWDAVTIMSESWDESSDVNITFDNGDSLFIPVHLVRPMYEDWKTWKQSK